MRKEFKVNKLRARPNISAFGIILVLIGLFWLARDLGYVPKWVPIWPFVLIIIGLYLILRKPWFEFW